MERFEILNRVGSGSFGTVWRAMDKESGEVVAIKRMKKKYDSWKECMSLPEVKSQRRMNHPNIVKLKEVIRQNDVLFFVFEYMECNLYQLMENRGKSFCEAEIRLFCFQIFHALCHMHQCGYFHRDLKPENLLVTNLTVKIADFGMAREISSKPPYTDYVSTRWYRAPEVLLGAPLYSAAIDMWAMGAILAELFSLRPLFPGSRGADQLYKICKVLGSPVQGTWSEGLHLAAAMNLKFPHEVGVDLSSLISSASKDAINLIRWLCAWDPCKRPTAMEVLQHSFFQPCTYIPPALRWKSQYMTTPPSVGTRIAADQRTAWKGGPTGSSYLGTGLAIGRSAVNAMSSMKSGNTIAVGAVQRKLAMDCQAANAEDQLPTTKYPKQQPHPHPSLRSNAGNERCEYGETPTATALAEKLSQLAAAPIGESYTTAKNQASDAVAHKAKRPPPPGFAPRAPCNRIMPVERNYYLQKLY